MTPGKGEIKSNPQVYTTKGGIEKIKSNPQVYTTQGGETRLKINPRYTLPIRGYKRD